MHVLIADALAPEIADGLEALGLEVTVDPKIHVDQLPTRIDDVHILIVGDTQVTRRAIEHASVLSLIVRAGAGTDTIDVTAASEHGIFVAHCPGYDDAAKAELFAAMVAALDRGLIGGLDDPPAEGLAGRTLGLYGFGTDAQALRALAAAAGMRVLAWSEHLTTSLASEAGVRLASDADSLFSRSDVVSLHPEGEEAEVIATAERLASMPDGATLVAIGRAGLIDMKAAAKRVDAGTLLVALDRESAGAKCPLEGKPGVAIAEVSASATRQASRAAGAMVVRTIHEYLISDEVPGCVNLERSGEAKALLIVRHVNKPGSLASILNVLRDEGINVFEVGNVLFRGSVAACTRLRVSAIPSPTLLERIRQGSNVFEIDCVNL